MAGEVTVALGDRSYPVHVVPQGFDGLGGALSAVSAGRRAVVVTEDRVDPLWGPALRKSLTAEGWTLEWLVLPAGEEHKTLDTWSRCVSGLLELGVDRRTPVLALGGGVLGDIAGFAAASTLRGLPFVQIPTTLLAMVDSSVGGKTAVNHARGKNLVGAFHQPRLVWAALDTLGTLEPVERSAGLGEVVKTALLVDPELFGWCEAHAESLRDGRTDALARAVAACVRVKAEVVAADERERGVRAWLNAGHTVGHGLEAALGYGGLQHGLAVGLGLIAETAWSRAEGHCVEDALPGRVAALLGALGLPTVAPDYDRARALHAMSSDKKLAGDHVRVPVPVALGRMTMVDVPVSALGGLLDFLPSHRG